MLGLRIYYIHHGFFVVLAILLSLPGHIFAYELLYIDEDQCFCGNNLVCTDTLAEGCEQIVCIDESGEKYVFQQWSDTSWMIGDAVYATERNLANRPLKKYDSVGMIIEERMISYLENAYGLLMQEKLSEIEGVLEEYTWVLILKDVYRPYSASVDLYASASLLNIPQKYIDFGDNHTRGSAVDITLGVKHKVTGSIKEVWMGSVFDEFLTHKNMDKRVLHEGVSHHENIGGWDREIEDEDSVLSYESTGYIEIASPMVLRAMFKRVMVESGFDAYNEEWRHYTLHDLSHSNPRFDFPIM